jgi:primosomal protein N' (replication factor Y)
VPLRKKIVEGIVLDVQEAVQKQEQYDILSVHDTPSPRALLTPAQLATLRWMATHYRCSLRQAMRVWLPAPPWKALLPVPSALYSLGINQNTQAKGSKQKKVLEELCAAGTVERSALLEKTGASAATLHALVASGRVHMEEQLAASRAEGTAYTVDDARRPALTSAQQSVFADIAADPRPSLLFGVTSSGKTEIYAALIAEQASRGRQSLLLVPEILLTEHCIDRFTALLGHEQVAVVHSRLTPAQRRNTWKRIHSGSVALVIGSRSALFAPLATLGLVILDEEHEWTYKNEQTPRYHAREAAEALCRFSTAKLVLGTATPSLESWHRAKNGVYHLARLPDRYNSHAFPSVRIIDLAEAECGSSYPLSPTLRAAIEERLARKEQSVLFLNRRGVGSALLCLDCRRRVVSPDSALPFTVHRDSRGLPILADHTTGLRVALPDRCPSCRSVRLHTVGAGTQKIEDLLAKHFPAARVLRADSDTLTHPEQMRTLLTTMRAREADILLGTQSVVKGLDLPEVTLAAVLVADVGLSLPHFRAGERVFQLLTQLIGRSGRAKPGEVIIQTFRPTAPEVQFAAQHRTEEYLDQEVKLREHAGYPPHTSMIRLLLRGPTAAPDAQRLRDVLRTTAAAQSPSTAISAAPTFFGGGKEWHVLIRGQNLLPLLDIVDTTKAVIDIDPLDCV